MCRWPLAAKTNAQPDRDLSVVLAEVRVDR